MTRTQRLVHRHVWGALSVLFCLLITFALAQRALHARALRSAPDPKELAP